MEDALRAYEAGRADGAVGRHDAARAGHPGTGPDYRVGVADGQLTVFESDLIAAVRRALGAKAEPAGTAEKAEKADSGESGEAKDAR